MGGACEGAVAMVPEQQFRGHVPKQQVWYQIIKSYSPDEEKTITAGKLIVRVARKNLNSELMFHAWIDVPCSIFAINIQTFD